MKTIVHKADTRGYADHGWLKANHSFSFASYRNPERNHFGVLRVLNDDFIAAGKGFGTHPHDNMEIITIPLEGELEHEDSMGNKEIIRSGEVQVMSAGTGVFHSEYNRSTNQDLKLLQIWVFPKIRNVAPRYDQVSIKDLAKPNSFYQVLSPNPDDQGVWIHQDAWFHLGEFDHGVSTHYTLKKEGNGVYAFIIEGEVSLNGQTLGTRDAMGIWDTDTLSLNANQKSRVLLLEVPMQLPRL